MQCCALKQRAVTVLSLYLQSAGPYPRKTGMEARDLGRVRLHNKRLIEEKTNEEYFVGITEYQHGAEDWMQMKKNILKLQGKIAQLKEVLENRENKIQELQKELSICQKNSGQVHNARGAGRKKMNREMRDRLALFDKLLGEGHPMSEIMGKMGISKATYFRYLKISRQGEENLGGMGSP